MSFSELTVVQLLRLIVVLIEEVWRQKPRQTVVVSFLGKMAAHLDCVADILIKAGRASITVTYCRYVLIKAVVLFNFSSVVALWTFTV